MENNKKQEYISSAIKSAVNAKELESKKEYLKCIENLYLSVCYLCRAIILQNGKDLESGIEIWEELGKIIWNIP